MKLNYILENKVEAEKFINLLIVGALSALEKGAISVDEAGGFIFKPYVANVLKKADYSSKLADLIMQGCELDDVESLRPELLAEQVAELKENALSVLKSFPERGYDIDKYIVIF